MSLAASCRRTKEAFNRYDGSRCFSIVLDCSRLFSIVPDGCRWWLGFFFSFFEFLFQILTCFWINRIKRQEEEKEEERWKDMHQSVVLFLFLSLFFSFLFLGLKSIPIRCGKCRKCRKCRKCVSWNWPARLNMPCGKVERKREREIQEKASILFPRPKDLRRESGRRKWVWIRPATWRRLARYWPMEAWNGAERGRPKRIGWNEAEHCQDYCRCSNDWYWNPRSASLLWSKWQLIANLCQLHPAHQSWLELMWWRFYASYKRWLKRLAANQCALMCYCSCRTACVGCVCMVVCACVCVWKAFERLSVNRKWWGQIEWLPAVEASVLRHLGSAAVRCGVVRCHHRR